MSITAWSCLFRRKACVLCFVCIFSLPIQIDDTSYNTSLLKETNTIIQHNCRLIMESRLRYRPAAVARGRPLSSTKEETRRRFGSAVAGLLAISLLAAMCISVSLHRNLETKLEAAHPQSKLLRDLAEFQQPWQRPMNVETVSKDDLVQSSPLPKNLRHNSKLQEPLVSSSSSKYSNYLQLSSATNDTSNDHPWSWPIIHTVNTRFMQNQGTLQNLARSRLKLLEAVCLPSIMRQSILDQQNLLELYGNTKWKDEVASVLKKQQLGKDVVLDPLFLWIIKVDPDIDEQILKELNTILEPVKHFTLVIGSNNNFGVGIKNGGWRDGQAGQDLLDAFRDDRVFFPPSSSSLSSVEHDDEIFGSSMHQIVRRAYEARSDRVLLETRVDADDAINVRYIYELQRVALKILINTNNSKFVRKSDDDDDDSTPEQEIQHAKWMYWCAGNHLEWNPSSPFYNPNNDAGLLTFVGPIPFCVTPGLTIGYAVGTDENDVPHYEHTKIVPEIKFKPDHLRRRDNITGCGLIPASDCLWVVNDPEVSAFRSRSMTSAGMLNIGVGGVPSNGEVGKTAAKYSKELWRSYIEKWFGIAPEKAKEAADFLVANYINTVRDNIRGQCTHDHSCKMSSVEKLQQSIDLSEEGLSGIEVK